MFRHVHIKPSSGLAHNDDLMWTRRNIASDSAYLQYNNKQLRQIEQYPLTSILHTRQH
jgi:hypothetical protein